MPNLTGSDGLVRPQISSATGARERSCRGIERVSCKSAGSLTSSEEQRDPCAVGWVEFEGVDGLGTDPAIAALKTEFLLEYLDGGGSPGSVLSIDRKLGTALVECPLQVR